MAIRMLSDDEVQRWLDPAELLDALAWGFTALSAGEVVAPPRNGVDVEGGFLLSMMAHAPGHPIGVKLVSVFHGNHAFGLPGHLALIALFDARTGAPVAVMNGTWVTALRTAGGAALSTRLLARTQVETLAIVGAGVQGEAHLRMLSLVRDFKDIRIASLRHDDARRVAATDPRARAVASVEEAVAGADVVCLCTTSSTPVVHRAWLAPGAHVTSVGYMPPGSEVAPDIVRHARLFVETRIAFAPPPAGCAELAGLDPEGAAELGEVLTGRRAGRVADSDLTLYKSMGHAVEDLVAARLVYERAITAGAGTPFAL